MPAMRKFDRGRMSAQKCCRRDRLSPWAAQFLYVARSFEGPPEPSLCQANIPSVGVNQLPSQTAA
jgi:hypothetical protein